MPSIQTTVTKNNKRSHHIWHYRKPTDDWKCVLCGAVTKTPTKEYSEGWVPERYEALTNQERDLAPYLL